MGTVAVRFDPVAGDPVNGDATIVGTPTTTQIVVTVPTGFIGNAKIASLVPAAGRVVSDDIFTIQ